MKIIVSKEEVKEVQAVIDNMLKSAGIQALQLAVKMAEAIELEADGQPQEGIEEKSPKVI